MHNFCLNRWFRLEYFEVDIENVKDVGNIENRARHEVQHPAPIEIFDKQVVVAIEKLNHCSYTVAK